MWRTAALLIAVASFAQDHAIGFFEIRENRLFAEIGGERRVLSTAAIRAWHGQTPNVILYSEKAGEGKQRLVRYDAFTREKQTVSTEDLDIRDVTPVLQPGGGVVRLISLREPDTNLPSVAIAGPNGVFFREKHATFGPAAGGSVQIYRYDENQLVRVRGDVSLLKPSVTTAVDLTPRLVDPVGIYEATLPAASAATRTITLNLRAGGVATMVTQFSGKPGGPFVRRGRWARVEGDVTVDFESPAESMTWTVTLDGLLPKAWDKSLWGSAGLHLERLEARPAPAAVPRRLPGTVR